MLAFGELLKQPNLTGLVFCLLSSVSLSIAHGDTLLHRARLCMSGHTELGHLLRLRTLAHEAPLVEHSPSRLLLQ